MKQMIFAGQLQSQANIF